MIKKSLLAVLALSSALAMASSALADCGNGMSGTVKWFNNAKGYGFITTANSPDIFVHRSGLRHSGTDLYEGLKVCFRVGQGPKGPQAVDVELDY